MVGVYAGEILVLFETPFGFAIFCSDGTQLFLPKAIENIWADIARDYIAKRVVMLREFQTFEAPAPLSLILVLAISLLG
jgi:nucleolar protein 58